MRRDLPTGLVVRVFNITNPGVEPVNGDFIRITYQNGNIEEKYFYL